MPGLPQDHRTSGDSRVLVLSQRRLRSAKHLTMLYEFEDAIRGFDDVTLVTPGPVPHAELSSLSRRAVNGTLHRLGRPRRSPPWDSPSMAVTEVVGEHDLFFAVFSDSWELSLLHRLKGWRERCRYAVCFITEVWSRGVAEHADYYEVLREFDAVHLFTPQAGAALAARGLATPTFLPGAVDAERFAPVPRQPERVLDVHNYGRTSPVIHQQLLDLVESTGLTYLYDTTFQAKVPDHREHRALLANMLQRSRFSVAHRINDSAQRVPRTGGEESLSSRYFEASASGAVLLGSHPDIPDFDACFDWPDAVIDLPYDSLEVQEVLAGLDGQPERLAQASAAGVRAALTRHDWVHRWEQVLGGVDLAVTPRMAERTARLADLASQVTPDSTGFSSERRR